jgi:hypothetical protein
MGFMNVHSEYIYNVQKNNNFIHASYTYDYPFDPYVILPTTHGEANEYGYFVQPAETGCMGFTHLV